MDTLLRRIFYVFGLLPEQVSLILGLRTDSRFGFQALVVTARHLFVKVLHLLG